MVIVLIKCLIFSLSLNNILQEFIHTSFRTVLNYFILLLALLSLGSVIYSVHSVLNSFEKSFSFCITISEKKEMFAISLPFNYLGHYMIIMPNMPLNSINVSRIDILSWHHYTYASLFFHQTK